MPVSGRRVVAQQQWEGEHTGCLSGTRHHILFRRDLQQLGVCVTRISDGNARAKFLPAARCRVGFCLATFEARAARIIIHEGPGPSSWNFSSTVTSQPSKLTWKLFLFVCSFLRYQ